MPTGSVNVRWPWQLFNPHLAAFKAAFFAPPGRGGAICEIHSACRRRMLLQGKMGSRHVLVRAILQIGANTFRSRKSLLEPGRICMICAFLQITDPRPMPMLDAVSGC